MVPSPWRLPSLNGPSYSKSRHRQVVWQFRGSSLLLFRLGHDEKQSNFPSTNFPVQVTPLSRSLQVPCPDGFPCMNSPWQLYFWELILPWAIWPDDQVPSAIISLVQQRPFPRASPLKNSPLQTEYSSINTPIPSGFPSLVHPLQTDTRSTPKRQVPCSVGIPSFISPLQQFPEGSKYHVAVSSSSAFFGSSFLSISLMASESLP